MAHEEAFRDGWSNNSDALGSVSTMNKPCSCGSALELKSDGYYHCLRGVNCPYHVHFNRNTRRCRSCGEQPNMVPLMPEITVGVPVCIPTECTFCGRRKENSPYFPTLPNGA